MPTPTEVTKNEVDEPSLKELAIRGTLWTIFGFGASMIIRFGGNLILTRILFPSAFGLMALVNIFIIGLDQFSDVGIGQNIVSSKRGDDPDFYNTTWTIQIIRGFVLTLCAWAIVLPYSEFYNEPALAQLLPVAALVLIIGGFSSTKQHTAYKHLHVSKLVQLEIFEQVFSLTIMIVLAWIYQSVWGLVIGTLLGTILSTILTHTYLPGANNKLHWNSDAAYEIIHFGKWIFLSTIAGYFINQGDRIVLGKLLEAKELGVYSIAFGLGALPQLVLLRLSRQILFPLYAKRDAGSDADFRKSIFKMRTLLTSGFMAGSFLLAFIGPMMIEFLYDDRYHDAGPMITAIALAFIPKLIIGSCRIASLSQGDSKRYSIMLIIYAIILFIVMTMGGSMMGIYGVVYSIALAEFLIYPVTVWSIYKYGIWMWSHDLFFAAIYIVALLFIFL